MLLNPAALLLLAFFRVPPAFAAQQPEPMPVSFAAIQALPARAPDQLVPYGPHPSQYAGHFDWIHLRTRAYEAFHGAFRGLLTTGQGAHD